MPFSLFNKGRSRKRYGRAKRKTTPNFKTRVHQWAQDQIANGVPRQDIVNQLYKSTSAVVQDNDAFINQMRAHMQGKGPMPTPHLQVQAYNQIADQIFSVMVNRNLKGREYEKAGNVSAAVRLYEANVQDHFDGTHPYDRLRIICTRQKRYDDAICVCEAYLALPDREQGQNKPHFQHHLERLQAKAASQG